MIFFNTVYTLSLFEEYNAKDVKIIQQNIFNGNQIEFDLPFENLQSETKNYILHYAENLNEKSMQESLKSYKDVFILNTDNLTAQIFVILNNIDKSDVDGDINEEIDKITNIPDDYKLLIKDYCQTRDTEVIKNGFDKLKSYTIDGAFDSVKIEKGFCYFTFSSDEEEFKTPIIEFKNDLDTHVIDFIIPSNNDSVDITTENSKGGISTRTTILIIFLVAISLLGILIIYLYIRQIKEKVIIL